MPAVNDSKPSRQLPSIRTADSPASELSTNGQDPEPRKHEKSHLHRRLHSSGLRHRAFTGSKDHHIRQAAKETVQSAIELRPPISFDTLLRRDKKSPDASRRDSASQPPNQQVVQDAERQAQEAQQRRVTLEHVQKARRENARREKELRNSLKNAEEVAMSSTRQLDDTYYSILERASVMCATVISLQQLADESRRMHAAFREGAAALRDETESNIASFGNFDAQEKTIDALVEQLRKSKGQTSTLQDRLESCRNRVEAFEKRETERQKTRRQRWRAMWAVLIGIAILLLAIATVKKRSAVGTRVHQVAKVLDEFGNEVAASLTAVLLPTASPSEDPYLKKLFDDL